MALLLVLLASSSITIDCGVLRSCLVGLHRLAHGLDTVCGSSDRSSDSIDPVIGGGSTTVEGPKKDGMSPEVVTGVLRSPGWASPWDWELGSSEDDWCRFESDEWWPVPVVLSRLRWGWWWELLRVEETVAEADADVEVVWVVEEEEDDAVLILVFAQEV